MCSRDLAIWTTIAAALVTVACSGKFERSYRGEGGATGNEGESRGGSSPGGGGVGDGVIVSTGGGPASAGAAAQRIVVAGDGYAVGAGTAGDVNSNDQTRTTTGTEVSSGAVLAGGVAGEAGVPWTDGMLAMGGAAGATGAPWTDGLLATGGVAVASGTATTGGNLAATGGVATGGNLAATGGAAPGGTVTGGAATGGNLAATGGAAPGGTVTGGAATGGNLAATGGAAPGGTATGGAAPGGTVTGGAAAGGTGVTPDGVAPTVVKVSPLANSTGVTEGPIAITFSEAMDTSSVQDALSTMAGFRGISWNGDKTVATVDVDFTFATTAKSYAYHLPTSIADASGQKFASALTVTFQLAAVATQELYLSVNLSGHRGTGASSCTTGTFVYAGDTDVNCVLRLGLSFEVVGALPAFGTTKGIESAIFRGQLCGVVGNPAALSPYAFEQVTFATTDAIGSAPIVSTLPPFIAAGTSIIPGIFVEHDVTNAVSNIWRAGATAVPGNHVQFRIGAAASNRDSTSDRFALRRTDSDIENNCPVSESATENRMRIIVRYFP